ncbi:MAG TPA: hypothetical protein VFM55_09605 [Micromonosporaceae bacterium]|nr:hypothetical protein [Micromonosporaceae bacterium]
MIVINICRIGVCAAFLVAAYWGAAFPILLVGSAVGAAVVGLPLRHFTLTARFAVVTWLVASLLMFALVATSVGTQQVAALYVSLAILLLAALHLGLLCMAGGPGQVRSSATTATRSRSSRIPGVVAAAGAATPAAIIAYGITSAAQAAWPMRLDGQQRILVLVMLSGVTTSLFVAAVYGLLHGGHRVNRVVGRLVRQPSPPRRLSWAFRRRSTKPRRRDGVLDVIGYAFGMFVYRIVQGLVAALRTAAQFVRKMLYFTAWTIVATVNWAHRWMVRARRRLFAALVEALTVLRSAAVVGTRSSCHTGRVVLLPLAILATAALLTAAWAEQSLVYLEKGSLLALAESAAAGSLAVGLLTAVWMLLSDLPRQATSPSAGRTLTISGANGLILVAVGGWALGLPGTLGYGVIRVGWVTSVATTILIVTGVWTWLRDIRTAPAT